ncbi:MAG: S-layer homology domain-containing protein [Bacteroidota bacterium]
MRRTMMLAVLVLILGLTLGQAAYAQFDDQPAVNSWVYQSFKLVYDAGLIKGYPDGTFRGSRPATRNEVVEFMARLMNYFDEKLAALQSSTDAQLATVKETQAPAPKPQPTPQPAEPKKILSEEDVKAMIAEALAGQDEGDFATQEDLMALSDDIYEAIQDLEAEFIEELDALDVRVTTLEEQVKEIQAKDSQQDQTIAKLQADLAAATKSLEDLKYQTTQDKTTAEAEAKKAKTIGLIGTILGILGIFLGP